MAAADAAQVCWVVLAVLAVLVKEGVVNSRYVVKVWREGESGGVLVG